MMYSPHSTAQLATVVEVELTGIARLRTAHKDELYSRTGGKLFFLPFFAKAIIEALIHHPLPLSSAPALVVIPWTDVDELVRMANSRYGLAAHGWGRDNGPGPVRGPRVAAGFGSTRAPG
jgi:hypothetical protein